MGGFPNAGGLTGNDLMAQQQDQPQPDQQQDPTEQLKSQLVSRISQLQPQDNGGGIKGLLHNFFQGAGQAMMKHVGLPTPDEEQQRLMGQYTNITNAQALDTFRRAQATQYTMVPVQLPDGTSVQMPASSAKAVLAAQVGAQSRENVADTNAQARLGAAQISAANKRPSAAARDDRFIQLSGVDPKTWTQDDQQFMKGYAKYVDFNKIQPGLQRAQVFAAPRWAALDPERQAQIAAARSLGAGVFGNQLTSFNALIGHLGDLKDAVGGLNNLDQRFLNTPINKLKLQTGDTKIQSVIAKIEPVRKEFESLLLNNRALYDADRESANIILSENASPAQLQTAMKSLAHTAAIRLGALNSTIKRVAGSDIPQIVEPSSGAILNEFGEDIPDYGGGQQSFSDVFKSPQGPPNRKATPTSQPKATHRYNPLTKKIEALP